MVSENQKSFLELRVVWKDEHMFQVLVQASNGDFAGKTEVYETSESLSEFALALIGYPKPDLVLFYEAGARDSYAYFSMKYYPLGGSGIVGIEVSLESYVDTEFRPEEKAKLKLEIVVEPNAIDNFQKELLRLAANQAGTATLYGRDNGVYN